VGYAAGFNGQGQGQSADIAIKNALKDSGISDAYTTFMVLAQQYECKGRGCYITTQFDIQPPAAVHAKGGLFIAAFANASLTVWVECKKGRHPKIKITVDEGDVEG